MFMRITHSSPKKFSLAKVIWGREGEERLGVVFKPVYW